MLSPSGLTRAALCPSSEVLPHVRTTTSGTKRGTTIHRYLADVRNLGRDEALVRVPEEFRPVCEAIDLNRLPASDPDAYQAEMSLAWNLATNEVRLLGFNLEREEVHARTRPGEMPMTLDVAGIDGEFAVALDYKTGWAPADRAVDNLQLKAYAVALALYLQRPRARLGIIRIPDHGEAFYDVATFDELSMAAAEEEIRGVLQAVADVRDAFVRGVPLRYHVGEHCTYCPAYSYCQANVGLVRQLTLEPAQLEEELTRGLTEDNAGAAWEKIRAAEKLVDRLKSAVRTFAESHGPIPLGDGWFLGKKTTTAEIVKPSIVKAALEETFGAEIANMAVATVLDASKKSIEEAMRVRKTQVPGSTLKALKETAFEAVRQRGGFTMRTTSSVQEFKHAAEKFPKAE